MVYSTPLDGRTGKNQCVRIRTSWLNARRVLSRLGFTVDFLRTDAWTLSSLPRLVDPAHPQDIHWKSPYDQMLKLLVAAGMVKKQKGITQTLPVRLPTIEQLRIIGAWGLSKILQNPEAFAFFKERVVDTRSSRADLTILPYIFDTFIASKQTP